MSFTTIYNPGQANVDGDQEALYRIKYSTEVLSAITRNFEFVNLVSPEQLTGAIGTEFWATGVAKVKGRNSTTDRLELFKGQNFAQNKKTVTVDPLIYVAHYIDYYDEKKSPIAAQQATEIAKAQGQAIAENLNIKVACTIIKAARSSTPNVVGQAGGLSVVNATVLTDGTKLVDAIEYMSTAFKTIHKTTPQQAGLTLWLPAGVLGLAKLKDERLNNKNFSYKLDATEPNHDAMLSGFQVVESLNIPQANLTTDAQCFAYGIGEDEADVATAFPSKYRGDYSNVIGFACNKEAIAAVVLAAMDSFVTEYKDRNGKLIATTVGMGFGVKDQRFAMELVSA